MNSALVGWQLDLTICIWFTGLLELILTTPPAERASGSTTKPNPKTRIASAKGRVKPLARLLRLRYGR